MMSANKLGAKWTVLRFRAEFRQIYFGVSLILFPPRCWPLFVGGELRDWLQGPGVYLSLGAQLLGARSTFADLHPSNTLDTQVTGQGVMFGKEYFQLSLTCTPPNTLDTQVTGQGA